MSANRESSSILLCGRHGSRFAGNNRTELTIQSGCAGTTSLLWLTRGRMKSLHWHTCSPGRRIAECSIHRQRPVNERHCSCTTFTDRHRLPAGSLVASGSDCASATQIGWIIYSTTPPIGSEQPGTTPRAAAYLAAYLFACVHYLHSVLVWNRAADC